MSLTFDLTYEKGPGAHTWDFCDQHICRACNWLDQNLIRENRPKRKKRCISESSSWMLPTTHYRRDTQHEKQHTTYHLCRSPGWRRSKDITSSVEGTTSRAVWWCSHSPILLPHSWHRC